MLISNNTNNSNSNNNNINYSYVPVDGAVGSIDVKPLGTGNNRKLSILIGTRGGDILEVTSDAGTAKESSSNNSNNSDDPRNLDLAGADCIVHVQSHSQGELWGLAVHPTVPDLVATVGDDGICTLCIQYCTVSVV